MSRATREPRHAPGAPRVPFAVLVISLIVGGLALLLTLNTASAANEIRRRDVAVKDASVAAQLQVVRNQVAASAAADNLGRAARDLGMVYGGRPAFLVIGPDGKVRLMGRPGAVSGVPVAAPTSRSAPTRTSARPSSTTTATSTSTRSASASTSSSATSTSTSRSTSRSASKPAPRSSPTATPKPTPTPTPTVTLPGGDR